MDKYALPLVVPIGIVVLFIWVLTAGRYWWFAYPVLTFWGGYIYLGFKIYPDEVGLLVAIAGFLVYAVKNREGLHQNRPPLTWALILLIAYFISHMSVSFYLSNLRWLTGGGSIIRVYSSGLIALLFCWLFYKFGSAQDVKTVITIVFAVLALRILLSLMYFSAPAFFDFAEEDMFILYSSADLRFSALYEMILSIGIYYFTDKRLVKNAILLFIFLLFVIILFGEGRVSTACAASILIIWMLLAKKGRLLVYLSPFVLILIIQVFAQAHLLSNLPLGVQRSLSFLPGLESQLIYATEGSNQWHTDLFWLGYEKWTNTWSSFWVGNIVDARDIYSFFKLNYAMQLEIASGTARYESTLWSVLATLGVVGFFFYVSVFAFLCRDFVAKVLKDGIISRSHGIYAMAVVSLTPMILFGWIRGGFPVTEILFCVMAKVLYEEQKAEMINI
ncbi:MAG: hypothetical protein NTX75_00175 [Proteobacteria bacterium]|nr:hypothetical protein [Pseudomonadota bacterium]